MLTPERGSESPPGPSGHTGSGDPLFVLRDVHKHFAPGGGLLRRRRPVVRAVDGVSLTIRAGETYGIVGESGCGKTTIARMLLLLERPTSGQITFEGRDLSQLTTDQTRAYRRAVQPVFQDPFSSLSPRLRVWQIIAEPLERTRPDMSRDDRRRRAKEVLAAVGLRSTHGDVYPHELSGGQRQRVAIARALASQPRCIILDEPVSALDVSIRAQLINLLRDLQQQTGCTFVFIAHDLAVVRYISERVGVMYLGKLVEEGPSEALYTAPQHPYTRALIANVPTPNMPPPTDEFLLEGELPSPARPPSGCRFRTRCPLAMDLCADEPPPPLIRTSTSHAVACHLHDQPAPPETSFLD